MNKAYVDNNEVAHVPTCSSWAPAWASVARISEPSAELEAVQAESRAALIEPTPFEWSLPDSMSSCELPNLDEWIERVGADGRLGFDRPGQLVASRWWEHTTFEELRS